MICSNCGGYVEWKGPLSNLTHTECASCGEINSQIPDGSEAEPICVVCGKGDVSPIARGDGTYDAPVCDEGLDEHYRTIPNAKAQPPPEQAKPAEGTQAAPAGWAVGCSALLGKR